MQSNNLLKTSDLNQNLNFNQIDTLDFNSQDKSMQIIIFYL